MKKRMRTALIAAVLLCIIFSAFVYTRPLTIEQRYSVLDLSKCVLIRGYFNDETSADNTPFTLAPDDPHFDEMVDLFQSAVFQTSLRNLLPQGTKIHTYEDGDFKWSVMFRFEDVLFPNGDTGSGDMLHIDNFFGDVTLSFDGKQTECSVKDQEQWLNAVMSIIAQYPD